MIAHFFEQHSETKLGVRQPRLEFSRFPQCVNSGRRSTAVSQSDPQPPESLSEIRLDPDCSTAGFRRLRKQTGL
jgi:hypothetical protein